MLESDLVRAFAAAVASSGIRLGDGRVVKGFIVGHEVALDGASSQGNVGAADLLMVTEDGRWWLIEAKLARSSEAHPVFLFANQLERYGAALERLGLTMVHRRLESYLYGRRSVLAPPAELAEELLLVRDLGGALTAWARTCGEPDPETQAVEFLRALDDQLASRTLTLAALIDLPGQCHRDWVLQNGPGRSLAVLTLDGACATLESGRLKPLEGSSGTDSAALPPFNQIPQSYKPTPQTIGRVLSPSAYSLYAEVLEARLLEWTAGAWPDVPLSAVTSAAFSVDLESSRGREICLQIGRSGIAEGGDPGMHPLKLIVNLIWAADRVHEAQGADRDAEYGDLENLVLDLCNQGGMSVRGVSKASRPGDSVWRSQVRAKMLGDVDRRPELVAVRLVGRREGYAWPDCDSIPDRGLLSTSLDAVERWLGPPPYQVKDRSKTQRAVPGSVDRVKC